jgi:hypothetical protein
MKKLASPAPVVLTLSFSNIAANHCGNLLILEIRH